MPAASNVILGCKTLNGRFPKFVTKNLPRGLRFKGSMLNVPIADFQELKENYADFNTLMIRGDIYRLGSRASLPANKNIPKVYKSAPEPRVTTKEIDEVQTKVDEDDEAPKPTIELGE